MSDHHAKLGAFPGPADIENAFALFEMEQEARDTRPTITPCHPGPSLPRMCDDYPDRHTCECDDFPHCGEGCPKCAEQARDELAQEAAERAHQRQLAALTVDLHRGILRDTLDLPYFTTGRAHWIETTAQRLLQALDELDRVGGAP
jgi:hypothetical protein